MPTQTYQIGETARLVIGDCHGDLKIEQWDQRAIEVHSRGEISDIRETSDALTIESVEEDLRLRLPADADVSIDRVHGDADIRGIETLQISRVDGDCALEQIAGTARLRRIDGDLRARTIGMIETGQLEGDLALTDAQTAKFGDVGGDAVLRGVTETLRFGNVGGDLSLRGGERLDVAGGGVGGDAALHNAAIIQLGEIGGDFAIDSVAGDLRLGNIGGDAAINNIGGALHMGNISGDAGLSRISGGMSIGN
ncbi:MAG TPA: hypothetical protein VFX76_22035, partial [Roseiflexaceae bacterium]|nr:hypothetical protein [Roseiflexaceae bacterium]